MWSRYWADGAGHALDADRDGLYDGPIAHYWRQHFHPLRQGEQVLDLATGNGALPRLLLATRPELDLSIAAVDVATIKPRWLASLKPQARRRLRFHGNTRIEVLPFPDGVFDLVTSQYGIEYADLDQAIAEAVRVTAAGGRLALLMHAQASRPVMLAAVEIDHLNWLLGPDGLLDAAEGILEPMQRSMTAQGRFALARDAGAHRLRVRFNHAQQTLEAKAQAGDGDGADVLFEIQRGVGQALSLMRSDDLMPASEHLQAIRLAAEDSRLRLRQLRRHALSPNQLSALRDALQAASAGDIQLGEVWERGHLMGCTLSARKAPR